MNFAGWVYELCNSDKFAYFAITGGLGSGKTTAACAAFFYRIIDNPKTKQFWIVAPTYQKVDDTVLPTCHLVLQEVYGMKPDIDYTAHNSKPGKILLHKSKQTIYLLSGDRPEYMTSATIGGFWITEPGIQSRLVFEKCVDRNRDKTMKHCFGIIEGTPEGANWYMDEFNIDSIDEERSYRRIKVHTEDNADNLAVGYIDRLKRNYAYNPQKLASYLYGEFTNFTTGNVFAQYAESRNVPLEPYKLDPFLPLDICYDFNATPLCWSAWQVQHVNVDGLRRPLDVCLFESSLDDSNLYESAKGLALKILIEGGNDRNIKLNIFGDRTGHSASHKVQGSDFENLQNYLNEIFPNVEIKAQRPVIPIRASVDVTNKLLLYQRILINPQCVNVRRSLSSCCWKIGTDDIEKPKGETYTHHADGLRYRIWQLYENYNPEAIYTKHAKKIIHGVNPQ